MASGGVYAETLELPKVPDNIVSGSTFIKWDDVRTSNYFTLITVYLLNTAFVLSLCHTDLIQLEQGQF